MGNGLCKPCGRRHKKLEQAGSVLDRVISQASNQDQCLLYRLANYKKGGELIDAYNQGGQQEVEKLIKEQFGVLLYTNGKGQMINRAEYLRWKFRNQSHVVLPIEASLNRHDPLAKWEDHEACWQMQYRGSLGETLLHVLIICDTRIHTKLARTLLKCFPKLAVDVVEGEEYLGASALHLAIAYNNNELVRDLVDAGANVNQRAIGSFFLPRDQQRLKPNKYTDYEGLAYLGEYPLAWAACTANESVYNLLLDSGAHPDLQDSFGNMILHMVVVCDKLDMFGYALRHPQVPASNGIVNKAGLTPLTLACKLGRAEVFREMLELSAKEFWRYSNITCSAYPLNALDTLLPDGRTNWNSALFIILNGTKEEHLDMLDGGIIQKLLEEKWKTYARNQFLKRLLILMVHLLCLSLAVYLRPEDRDEPLLVWTDDLTVVARYACEIGTLIGVLSYVVFQQGDEIKNQGLLTFLKQQSHAPAKAIFLISNLLILACIPCRLIGDKKTEEAILVFAVPGSWFLLMFFAGAVRLTGPFVTMIYSMITGDMLTFGIIYSIVLFGFSQSFYFLYKGYPKVKDTLYNSYFSTWMALFQITLGDYNYTDLSMTTYPGLSKTVFAIFMVFVPILLLNMLIAMMGNTYAHVIEQSEKEWMKQWAKIVVTLERAVAVSDAQHYLQEYSIKLGPGEEPGTEQRGVMIIKSKSKTRAKQRKGALANWKRVGKVTITALRKRGLTGEQLRCIMWGRESISTPVKVKGPVMDPTKLKNDDATKTGGGFGGALTAALDVMAFAHDLDLGANGAIPVTKPPPFQNVNNTTAVPNINATNVSVAQMNLQNTIRSQSTSNNEELANSNAMFGIINQLADSQIEKPLTATNVANLQQSLTTSTIPISNDPLRDLVLLSSKDNNSEQLLEALAIQAANLPYKAVMKKRPSSVKTQIQSCVNDMFSLGTATAVAKSKFDEVRKKQFPTLDPSDSDGFGEAPLLGKISRQRRTRSANARNSSAKSEKSKTMGLTSDTESSSSENDDTTVTYEQLPKDDDDLDFASERIRQVKESLQLDAKRQNVRPTNIDIAVGIPINIPDTVSGIVIGTGDGAEVETGNLTKQSPSDTTTSVPIKKRRPKTARTNKVSPEDQNINKNRRHSAKFNDPRSPESPPDPLEPWSTRPIANMNTILAWEDEQNNL